MGGNEHLLGSSLGRQDDKPLMHALCAIPIAQALRIYPYPIRPPRLLSCYRLLALIQRKDDLFSPRPIALQALTSCLIDA